MIKFKVRAADKALLNSIIDRAITVAAEHGIEYSRTDIEMDLTACHLNGCPLDLKKLLTAPEIHFAHDLFGIRRFLDRRTGRIDSRKFDPRCSLSSRPNLHTAS